MPAEADAIPAARPGPPGSEPSGAPANRDQLRAGPDPRPIPRGLAPFVARRRRLLVLAVVLVAAVLALSLFVVSALTAAAPSWWRRMHPGDPTTTRLAARVENAALTEINKLRPADEPWRIAVSDEQVSAWLTGSLPAWLAAETGLDEWPPHLSELQVRFHPGRVTLAARIDPAAADREPDRRAGADGGSFVSLSLTPRVQADGSLWLTPRWVYLGRLPLPAGMMTGRARDTAVALLPPQAAESGMLTSLTASLSGSRAAAADPVLVLADGARRVRLIDIRLEDGRAILTCATEHARTAAAD